MFALIKAMIKTVDDFEVIVLVVFCLGIIFAMASVDKHSMILACILSAMVVSFIVYVWIDCARMLVKINSKKGA